MKDYLKSKLTQTDGDHGLRFAGPDLLDYEMIFKITGGEYDGKRMIIRSSYHVCCGTLEVEASLFGIYKRWRNRLDGCKQHQREEKGERGLRGMVWNMHLLRFKYQATVFIVKGIQAKFRYIEDPSTAYPES